MASGVKYQHLLLWKDANGSTVKSVTLQHWAQKTLTGDELTEFNTFWTEQQAAEQALIDAGKMTREIITVDADGNNIPACYKISLTDWDADSSVVESEGNCYWHTLAAQDGSNNNWAADYEGVVVGFPGYGSDGSLA